MSVPLLAGGCPVGRKMVATVLRGLLRCAFAVHPCVVGVAQLVRAPDCGSGGRGFETRHSPQRLVSQSQLWWNDNGQWQQAAFFIGATSFRRSCGYEVPCAVIPPVSRSLFGVLLQ